MLTDKIAVVTGGADGIGRKIALELAGAGANIAVMDIDFDKAAATCVELKGAGVKALAVKVDVRNEEEVKTGFQKVLAEFGVIDILVNNAGIFRQFEQFKNWREEDCVNMVDLNLLGLMRCCRAVLPGMAARQSGKIINIASVAGVAGIANMAVYSASKGAVIAFTKALAMEEGRHNITVNCISPGALNCYPDEPDRGTYFMRSGDLGAETAHMVRFLASGDSDYITGVNYIIDGGRLLGPRKA